MQHKFDAFLNIIHIVAIIPCSCSSNTSLRRKTFRGANKPVLLEYIFLMLDVMRSGTWSAFSIDNSIGFYAESANVVKWRSKCMVVFNFWNQLMLTLEHETSHMILLIIFSRICNQHNDFCVINGSFFDHKWALGIGRTHITCKFASCAKFFLR